MIHVWPDEDNFKLSDGHIGMHYIIPTFVYVRNFLLKKTN